MHISNRQRIALGSGIAVLLIIGFFYTVFFRPPADFPSGAVISVARGTNLKSIADQFEREHIVRSSVWLTNFVILIGRAERVTEGDYYFPKPESVYSIARRITSGNYKLEPTKVTFPEGSSIFDMAEIITDKFPRFNERGFLAAAKDLEGYLFPDTYLFMPSVSPEDMIRVLRATFATKIAPLEDDIAAFGKPLNDVVTMASILEGEARLMETRQMVAGILWKRLREGMPLQVDAAFKYVNGKTSEELTQSDLRIDSPYNTYRYKGLPPTPISNPGLDAIKAAITPIDSPYYYFLTDDNGTMHYAKTLEEHAANSKKYLR